MNFAFIILFHFSLLFSSTFALEISSSVSKLSTRNPPIQPWLNDTLWWPFPKFTLDNDDHLPSYSGSNEAEGCPSQLRFKCSRCSSGCDGGSKKTDTRPCKSGDHNPSTACYPVPRQPWEGTNPTRKLKHTTRNIILQRAAGWLSDGFQYEWKHTVNSTQSTKTLEACSEHDDPSSCPKYRYMLDCDGFVKMSWSAPVGKKLKDNADRIDCDKLQPGDAICHYSSEGHKFKHTQLFRKWTGPFRSSDKTRPWILYQMGGGFGKVNELHGRFHKDSENNNTLNCFRRKNIN